LVLFRSRWGLFVFFNPLCFAEGLHLKVLNNWVKFGVFGGGNQGPWFWYIQGQAFTGEVLKEGVFLAPRVGPH